MAMTLKPQTRHDRVQVLVVDDHPIFRQGLKQIIEAQPDMVVCAQAEDGQQAMEAVQAMEIGLAIVDVTLRGRSGLEVVRDLKVMRPRLPVLVMSMHDESLYAERALRAGASGYLTKQEASSGILTAIRRILDGHVYLSDALSTRMVRRAVDGAPVPAAEPPVLQLSDRELEVFELLGQGLSTRQIASRLYRSVKTVESHRENIKAKLGLTSSGELLRYAVEHSLLGEDAGGKPQRLPLPQQGTFPAAVQPVAG